MNYLFPFKLLLTIGFLLFATISINAQTKKQSARDIPQNSAKVRKAQMLKHNTISTPQNTSKVPKTQTNIKASEKTHFPNKQKKVHVKSRKSVKAPTPSSNKQNSLAQINNRIEGLESKITYLKSQTPQTDAAKRKIVQLEQLLVKAVEQKSIAVECK